MGTTFTSVLPRGVENILLMAWGFPSLIQGVAGFGPHRRGCPRVPRWRMRGSAIAMTGRTPIVTGTGVLMGVATAALIARD